MIAARQQPRWPFQRWLLFILIIVTGQFTVIFWLSGKSVATAKTPPFSPHVFYLPANARLDLPGVSDPTLFALPNRRGFSGPAWMEMTPPEYDAPKWTESARPLALPVQRLGGALAEFARTNQAGAFDLTPPSDPQADLVLSAQLNLGVPHSEMTVEGDLAHRTLLSQFDLQPQPATDILTNSTVLASVDAQGGVFSAVLLYGCGSPAADKLAVSLARSARFNPLRSLGVNPPPTRTQLTWGRLIFHWQTVPATTNIVAP